MINVKVNYLNDQIDELVVKGHSNFAPKGSDIVCAGVSAIVIGGINAIISLVKDQKVDYEVNDGYVKLNNLNNIEVQNILKVVIIQLKSVEDSYSKHIKIVESYQ
jgi:uncharacterized protein YsxB (DUF464 family)